MHEFLYLLNCPFSCWQELFAEMGAQISFSAEDHLKAKASPTAFLLDYDSHYKERRRMALYSSLQEKGPFFLN